ncbi:MAG: hypothetical protein HY825_14565 [Acidobacteria bacterium]|nr:hypothetical protein [Acidobacteriota bacterium]
MPPATKSSKLNAADEAAETRVPPTQLRMDGPANLHWTGHALIDVGVAGLCAFAGKNDPQSLTLFDLDAAADLMEREYYGGKLGTYLSCVFMNASFVQPSESQAKRATFIAQYLRAHRASPQEGVAGARCAFSGQEATSLLVRTHLPLFSGEDVLNFRPDGQTAVPAAGAFVVALMFLPLASRRAEGRLLAVHADDPTFTLTFARRFLADNRRLLALALPTAKGLVHDGYDRELPKWDAPKKQYKFADLKGPRSFVLSELTGLAVEAGPGYGGRRGVGLTAYLVSNSGQGPSLEIFEIPSGTARFVLRAASATTASAWRAIAADFRPLSEREDTDTGSTKRRKARAKTAAVPGRAGWTRNPAFEELCAVFDAGFTDRKLAAAWLRRHVLRAIDGKQGTRFARSSARSWALADLFLREVMGMKQARIDAVREFADRVAQWIHERNDRRLERALFTARGNSEVRHALMRAQRESGAAGRLLFGLDDYARVFLHEDRDEALIRDLVCIRLAERLPALGTPVEVLEEETPTSGSDPEEREDEQA